MNCNKDFFFKKGEWCAPSFLLLNTVKQSESSYLAFGEQRAVVPLKVKNDQDLCKFLVISIRARLYILD